MTKQVLLKAVYFTTVSLCFLLIFNLQSAEAFDAETELSHAGPNDGYILNTIKNDLDNEIIIYYEITDLNVQVREVNGERFSVVDIPNSGYTRLIGKPVLPTIGKMFHISDTGAPEVSIRILESHEMQLHYPVIPAQDDQEVPDIQQIDFQDWGLYQQNQWFPLDYITAKDPEICRDVRLLPIGYFPIRYNAARNVIEVIDKAEIVIQITNAASPNEITFHGPYSASYEHFYRAIAPNYSDVWIGDRSKNIPEHYLFIMPDEFESRCQGFFAWKEQQGFIIDVIKLSELGSYPDHADVKNAILSLYQSVNRPVYASIIGSTNNFPIHESYDSYMSGNFDDDLYYSQLDGSDFLADIFLSRYPAVDPDELSIMLAKILTYEQNPNMEVSSLYKTALMACSGLYSSQQLTKEQTADRMTANLGYETIHTMYNWYSGAVSQVQEWMNAGVSIINYRGEGWRAGWHPAHSYDFEYPEVYALNNTNLLPVITSIGCGVSMFDGYSECFGHAWMVHGSLADQKGAVAFFGPTWNTRTTINNWIDRGIYRGFCYHNLTRSSQALDYGKMYAYQHFIDPPQPPWPTPTPTPQPQSVQNCLPTHMREYVLFGNPDLWWRTSFPRTAQVYNAWCPNSGREGMVIIDETGAKLANAQVCFLENNESRVYVTDGGGGCKLYMDDISGPVPYTLTGWNLVPCTGTYDLPEDGDDGDLVITEIKPDIMTSGIAGDKVEIVNLEIDVTVNLKNWTIGDLDGYDVPFTNQDALLEPQSIAVIEFVGPEGTDTVTSTGYGLLIKSTAVIGLSSLEDTAVLRNTTGRVRDAVCWHNGSGIGSTDETNDMSKVTLPTSTLSMGFRGWWTGADEVAREDYETFAVDWSAYAGNGGPGSIQRTGIPGSGVYDSPDFFAVEYETSFGVYEFSRDSMNYSVKTDSKKVRQSYK